MTEATGELPTEDRGTSQRDVLANRCPGWVSGPGATEPTGTPHTMQPHHYHLTPDTVSGYCGDTTLGLCSSLVNKTDGYKEEERRKDRGQEDIMAAVSMNNGFFFRLICVGGVIENGG